MENGVSIVISIQAPGGRFIIGHGRFSWVADDEHAPPYHWGWENNYEEPIKLFQLVLDSLKLAQEAKWPENETSKPSE